MHERLFVTLCVSVCFVSLTLPACESNMMTIALPRQNVSIHVKAIDVPMSAALHSVPSTDLISQPQAFFSLVGIGKRLLRLD